jgi:protein ImuA
VIQAASLPHVWRAPELARTEEVVIPTGHPQLDAHLPGGGWPVGSMVEVLQQQKGRHHWQLLLPALVRALAEKPGPIVLVNPPHEPFVPALMARGVSPDRMLCVKSGKPAAQLWAAEQCLRGAEVAAVMAWLPRAKSTELRRLHMAAQQHEKLFFIFRDALSRQDASCARLRILVEESEALQVHILKRRGPPLEVPVALQTHPERLSSLLAARKGRAAASIVQPLPTPKRSHVLDRIVALT